MLVQWEVDPAKAKAAKTPLALGHGPDKLPNIAETRQLLKKWQPEMKTFEIRGAEDHMFPVKQRGQDRRGGRRLDQEPGRHEVTRSMSTGTDATTALLPALIVGAGPAGLASAACLKQRGIKPLVLEAGASLANSWRYHYDRLRLHTVKQQSAFAGVPFAKELGRYPTRAEVIAYRPSCTLPASPSCRAQLRRCAACLPRMMDSSWRARSLSTGRGP